MLAFVLSSALLAMAPSSTASAPTGYSQSTTLLLEKLDNGMLRPVRQRRPLTIGTEVGFNGLGGIGGQVGYNINPHFSLDAGAGLGLPGVRFGMRGRYNFLKSNWTPFVGLGFNYLLASEKAGELETNGGTTSVSYRVDNSPFASGMLGMNYQGDGGFTAMAGLGWSQLLTGASNVTYLRGMPSKADRRALDLVVGSGPIASVMLGYSF